MFLFLASLRHISSIGRFGKPFEFVGLHPRFARSSVELQSSADASTGTEERETIASAFEKTDDVVQGSIPYEMRTRIMK